MRARFVEVEVGDYIRKDGELVEVVEVRDDDAGRSVFTSDGGVIAEQDIPLGDVLLPSEVNP